MRILGTLTQRLEDIGRRFTVEVFGRDTQPLIEDALKKHGKHLQRKCKLTPERSEERRVGKECRL